MTSEISHFKLARYPELLEGKPRPIHWDVDPSSVCDHRCTGCPYIFDGATDPMLGVARPESAPNKRAFLEYSAFLSFLDDAKICGARAITFVGGGEPTLHPKFADMASETHRRGLKFGVVTHLGLEYSDRFFEVMEFSTWIRVSLNAATHETYFKHQGKDCFDQVIDNAARLAKKVRVGISFLITPDNYQEVSRAARLARDIGCVYIQFKPLITAKVSACAVLSTKDKIILQLVCAKTFTSDTFQVLDQWDTRTNELAAHERGEFSGRCHVPRINPKLGANGTVYTCCELAYSTEGAIGNIYEELLEAILDRAGEKQMEMKTCPHCWDKPLNRIINSGKLGSLQPPPDSVDKEFV